MTNSQSEAKTAELKNWNEPDKDGNINVPDYLDKLFNKVAFQIRFHSLSGKNEIQAIADIVYIAEKFFKEQKEQAGAKTAQPTLAEVYKSALWQEIQDNFRAFDELIESDELRDFYKRLIWELVTSKTAGLEADNEKLKEAYNVMLNAMPLILKSTKIEGIDSKQKQELINIVTKGAAQLLKLGFDLCGLRTHINATLELGDDRFELAFVKHTALKK